MTHHVDLGALHLASGAHGSWEQGACLLEAVAYFAGEPWSDHPKCVSPVLGEFGRSWNDSLPDKDRQRLVPLIPRMVGTAADGADDVRAWLATDWLVRTFTPVWLDKAGLTEDAAALRALPELTSSELAAAAQPIIEGVRQKAAAWAAARDAAGDAAWDAAWDAAGAAAWAAARDAAGDAAWDAAGAAAWAAAWDAAWDAAGAAARDAAWDAAGAAAWDAAGDAAWDAARDAAWDAAGAAAWAAAGAAAWDAAQPKRTYQTRYDAAYAAARKVLDVAFAETVAQLQDSAFDLFSRMIDPKARVTA